MTSIVARSSIAFVSLFVAGCVSAGSEEPAAGGAGGAGGTGGTGGTGGSGGLCSFAGERSLNVTGVTRYNGERLAGATDRFNTAFGRALVVADLDGEGGRDLIVGAPLVGDAASPQRGRVYVFFDAEPGFFAFEAGDPRPSRWLTIDGDRAREFFGSDLAVVPRADKGADLLVGGGRRPEMELGPAEVPLVPPLRATLLDGHRLAALADEAPDGTSYPVTSIGARLASFELPASSPLEGIGASIRTFVADLDGDERVELVLGQPRSAVPDLLVLSRAGLPSEPLGEAAPILGREQLPILYAFRGAGGEAFAVERRPDGRILVAIGDPAELSRPADARLGGVVRTWTLANPATGVDPGPPAFTIESSSLLRAGDHAAADFGVALALLELLDEDGRPGPELVVGAPGAAESHGLVLVLTVPDDGGPPVVRTELGAVTTNRSSLGRALVSLPDSDGDGHPELALAQPDRDVADGERRSENAGAVWLLPSGRLAPRADRSSLELEDHAAVLLTFPEGNAMFGDAFAPPPEGSKELWIGAHHAGPGRVARFDLEDPALCWDPR